MKLRIILPLLLASLAPSPTLLAHTLFFKIDIADKFNNGASEAFNSEVCPIPFTDKPENFSVALGINVHRTLEITLQPKEETLRVTIRICTEIKDGPAIELAHREIDLKWMQEAVWTFKKQDTDPATEITIELCAQKEAQN